MILRLSAALAAAALFLVACGSDDPQPAQPAQPQPTAYQAGESESRQQQQEVATQQEALAEPEQAPEQVRDRESSEQAQDQPVAEQDADGQDAEMVAMVGQIIETGHRAGLFADRNSLGSLDAPIVITEYSDFL